MLIRLRPSLLLPALLLAAWLAYAPGLSGQFLFDDFPNLAGLSQVQSGNAPGILRYLTSGTADPLGRPIALLTFLVNADDWPDHPVGFLRFNLSLHLLNGALLYLLLRALGRQLPQAGPRSDWAALLGSGLWLLHPLFVSTTLYAVQREAMLPATFIIAGLLAYCHGRQRFLDSAGKRGLAWMVGGIGLGTALAGLSKANGLLLPLLAWTLEATVLTHADVESLGRSTHSRLARARCLLIVLPSLALLVFSGWPLLSGSNVPANRPWSIFERVLTEPRVLFDYLQLLAIPRAVSTGLYNDAYAFSTGLLEPPTTLLCALGILALLAGGIALRRRAPVVSSAILFFLAGHVFESGAIPLELYFEHRNYVPALLLFWPIATAIVGWRAPAWKPALLSVALLGYFGVVTAQRASLWSDPGTMALVSLALEPHSSRAQAAAAFAEASRGRAARAHSRLDAAWTARPADLQLGIAYVRLACATGGLGPEDTSRMADALRTARTGLRFASPWLIQLSGMADSRHCPGLRAETIAAWLQALRANPGASSAAFDDREIAPVQARVLLRQGRPEPALAAFNRALVAVPAAGVASRQATELAAAGYPREALAHLDFYDTLPPRQVSGMGMARLHSSVLAWQDYWPRELAELRGKLQAELAPAPPRPTTEP